MCGVRMTLSSLQSGWSAGSGSSLKTSSAAPAMRRCSSAVIRAGSSTMPPRATLIRKLDGRIAASTVALTMPCVAAVYGVSSTR